MKRFYDFDWDEQNMPLKIIPGFRTEKKEHEFWSTHSSADYNLTLLH